MVVIRAVEVAIRTVPGVDGGSSTIQGGAGFRQVVGGEVEGEAVNLALQQVEGVIGAQVEPSPVATR